MNHGQSLSRQRLILQNNQGNCKKYSIIKDDKIIISLALGSILFSSNTTKINTLEFQKYNVSSYAEIWQSPETGEKSLHSLVQFMPGDTIAKLGGKALLEQPNYLTVQIGDQEHILLDPEFLQ